MRELVGVRGLQADALQQGLDPAATFRARGLGVDQVEGLGDQVGHLPARVEAAVGVLEHHLHVAARGGGGVGAEGTADEGDLAGLDALEPQDGAGEGGFPAAALADQADVLAGADGQVDAVDGAEQAAGLEEALAGQAVVADHLAHAQHLGARLAAVALGAVGGGGEERARVGMRHGAEQGGGLALLDHLAVLHDGDAVGHVGHHREVVGDHQEARAVLLRQFLQEVEDHRLGGDVQCGGRLVGDQEARAQGDGHGDHHPLALAAGEVVGVAVERELLGRQTGAGQRLARGGAGVAGLAVDADHLGHLLADGLQGIEGRHRLLEDHADAGAAEVAHLPLAEGGDQLAVEADGARADRPAGQQLHDRQRGHGFARAALAHQPQALARRDGEADVAQDRHAADGEGEAVDLQQAHRARLSLGSSQSRRPSPIRFSPSTVSTMARPGKIANQGAT